jgi:hypothetical protein
MEKLHDTQVQENRLAMKLFLLFAIWPGLQIESPAQNLSGRLEGCEDPKKMAASLRMLRDGDWRGMSFTRLQEIWPASLKGLNCDEKVCSAVGHDGRVIDNVLQCGEVFDFEIGRAEGGAVDEHLYHITIHYTARTRDQTISAARGLSSALGLTSGDIAKIGSDEIQYFHWETSTYRPEQCNLQLDWHRLGSNWNLFLTFDRRSK